MTEDPIRIRRWPKFTKPARRYLRLVAVVALGLVSYSAPAGAQQATFADFPVVIFCEYHGTTSAYYFSQLADGVAIYITPDRQAGVITIDGTARRIGGDRSGTCLDKTLADLRASGQAFDLPR